MCSAILLVLFFLPDPDSTQNTHRIENLEMEGECERGVVNTEAKQRTHNGKHSSFPIDGYTILYSGVSY